jgi:glycosyltransferase involved in cell wall biosynthesis
MNLACVVHRYGVGVAGGSEAHCRAVATRLAGRHDVTVLTTCAADHVSWRNVLPPGESNDSGIRVHRFRVAHPRSLHRFDDISDIVFSGDASESEQEQWFRENGPETPELLAFLRERGRRFDRVLFWAFRYYHSYFGLPIVADRAVLVPTAEHDEVIGLPVVGRFFTLPAGFLFLTPEEQSLVERHATRPLAPSCVAGTGLEPAGARPGLDRARLGIDGPFVLYLGRVDPNKGCDTLFRHFLRWQGATDLRVPLVLAGPANMPVPEHPQIRFLGYVGDALREALVSNAAALILPSPLESLSLALLEAWNHGTAALVNGDCEVLRGQAVRADGALYYRNYDEFARGLEHLLRCPESARTLGRQGLAYVDREYRWPKVLDRLEGFLQGLGSERG